MAVPTAVIPEGTRVRIRQALLPIDPAAVGHMGVVVDASEYHAHSYGVVLDGEQELRFFAPTELEIVQELVLPPEREAAKQRRALP
ncbi:MAG: hypothetical protein HY561_02700 [Gemmatimonadetes bacterium]|nr:hypothetical protein [Gemmatimonadota bacterium]